MTWLELEAAMLDGARAAAGLCANWLFQSTLLIVGGLLIGYLLRRRGSAVQSAVYRTTLVAVLACPLATWGLSQLGVAGWSFEMPLAYLHEEVSTVPPPPAASAAPQAELESAMIDSLGPRTIEPTSDAAPPPIPPSVEDLFRGATDGGFDVSVPPQSAAPQTPPATVTVAAATSVFTVYWFGLAALAVSAFWAAGTACQLIRLASAWRQLGRIRRGASRADAPTLECCRSLARLLRVVPPDVLHSPFLPSPCLAGLRRPAVMLPETEMGLPIRDVLTHELAHLARRDGHWHLLCRITTSLFFFQPLLWRLARRLYSTAEEVCDDYVVQFGGDRGEYAHRLVDVAELSIAPIAAAGVGIVSLRSMLAARVTRIMDTSRSLSTCVRGPLLAMVLLAGLTATLLVGLVGVGPNPAAAEAAPAENGGDGDVGGAASEPTITPDEESADTGSGDVITVRGRVVDADGNAIAGATVYVVSNLARDLLQPGEQVVLARGTTGPDGRFEFDVMLPARDSQIDRGVRDSRHEQIVAVAAGYAPAMQTAIALRKGEELTLTLAKDDLSIEGRILDLEGEAVSGATVNVAILADPREGIDKQLEDLRARARQEKPNEMVASIIADEDFLDSKVDFSVNESLMGGRLSFPSVGLPEPVKTDEQGRFRITGIGRDRTVALQLTGPNIVSSWLSVITRDMPAIQAPLFIGGRTSMTFGAQFSCSAEPSQPIQGTVTDSDTGQPIAGVRVEAEQYDAAYASAITDQTGRYRLAGIPKKKEHWLRILPPADKPYFARRFVRVTDIPDGLEAITFDVSMKPAQWIEGKVTDKATGEPVAAKVCYMPYIDNPLAEDYPSFRKDRITDLQDRDGIAETRADGSFRVVAVPGKGILAAVASASAYCLGVGQDALAADRFGFEGKQFLNTYDSLHPRWVHVLREVDVPQDSSPVQVDLQLDPGHTLVLDLQDARGQPLTGVRVRGRLPSSHWIEKPLETARVEIKGIDPRHPRAVFLYHSERNLGHCLLTNLSRSETRVVRLAAAGTLRGRVLGAEGKPLAETIVGIKPALLADDEVIFPIAKTDKDGHFETKHFIPNTEFLLYATSVYPPAKIGEAIELEPGQTLDLGELRTDAEARRAGATGLLSYSDDDMDAVTALPEAVSPVVGHEAESPRPAAVETDSALVYEGQVLTPEGKPAVGVEIFLVYWYPTLVQEVPARSLAVTDGDGRFRFQRKPSEFHSQGAAVPPWATGSIVAKAKEYGVAWGWAAAFETTGAARREAEKNRERIEFADELFSQSEGSLRLVSDDTPITGQIVDTEGVGIAGAMISVLEIATGADGTLASWQQAARGGKADYFTLRNALHRELVGPELSSLVGPATTDAAGRFTVRGIGQNRIAKLLIRGRNIETVAVYARTSAGAKMTVPFERGLDYWRFTYYGSKVSHVAAPAKPVMGTVTDTVTGKPIAGVVLRSSEYYVEGPPPARVGSEHATAVTDAQGRFRLDGLPRSASNPVQFLASDGNYLPFALEVDTRGNDVAPVRRDAALTAGVVVEGRVTDATTGEGIKGSLQFLPTKENPNRELARAGQVGPSDDLASSDAEGRFRIVVPPGPGYLGFTAFAREIYPFRPRPDDAHSATMFYHIGGEFHVVHNITAQAGDASMHVDLQLTPLPVISGQSLDSEGRPLENVLYVGRTDVPRWYASKSGEIKVYGYDGTTPRRMAFFHKDRKLAGIHLLRGEGQENFRVKLEPWAAIKGRIVDENGDPVASVRLYAERERNGIQPDPVAMAPDTAMPLPLPPADELDNSRHLTDDNGFFEIVGLVAGHEYHIEGQSLGPFGNSGVVVSGLVLKPSEARDLGTITFTRGRN